MKTLKDVLDEASSDNGEAVIYDAKKFASYLEYNGYCIVPMEATGKIGKAMKLCEDGSRSIKEAYREIIAARPKLGD